MKFSLKPLLLGTVLSAVSLNCTLSFASSDFSAEKVVSQQLAIVQHAIIDNSLNATFIVNSYERMLNKPLLIIPVNEVHGIRPISFNKKGNELFEFVTVFNDKLQQLISIFDNTSTTYLTDKNSFKEVVPSVFSKEKCESEEPKKRA